ncbi:unnamed protein product, partial [Prorocentrum cordatum]
GALACPHLARAVELQKPLLLRGAADGFAASSEWTRRGLGERLGHTPLRRGAWWPWAAAPRAGAAEPREGA